MIVNWDDVVMLVSEFPLMDQSQCVWRRALRSAGTISKDMMFGRIGVYSKGAPGVSHNGGTFGLYMGISPFTPDDLDPRLPV